MTPQIGQQTVTILISPNISRSKGNQAMKFHQLMKYSVRNTFLQKPCRKCGRETNSRPVFVFLKSFKKVKANEHVNFNVIVKRDLDIQKIQSL